MKNVGVVPLANPVREEDKKIKNKNKESEKSETLVDIEQLKKDTQVQRALDILVGYGIFSGLK